MGIGDWGHHLVILSSYTPERRLASGVLYLRSVGVDWEERER
jgi:hypothetical protein